MQELLIQKFDPNIGFQKKDKWWKALLKNVSFHKNIFLNQQTKSYKNSIPILDCKRKINGEKHYKKKKGSFVKKNLSKPADQITAPVSKGRMNEAPPFLIFGLDFAGPICVKKLCQIQKSHIFLLTCGVTRVLHLEHVADITTDFILLVFRQFLASRRNCKNHLFR